MDNITKYMDFSSSLFSEDVCYVQTMGVLSKYLTEIFILYMSPYGMY